VAAELIRDIASGDEMYGAYPEAAAHYFDVGASAIDGIQLCLRAAGKDRVGRILDLPCGHGRVLRHLKAAFPEAMLTACDVNRDGADFCARTFGARAVYGEEDPRRNRIDDTFDLIWCGSLLTHVEAERWESFLRWFTSRLEPRGLLVFTTLGRVPGAWVGRQLTTYGLGRDGARKLSRAFERKGFGYVNYPHASSYGIALASPAWVVSQLGQIPELRIVHYAEARWDDHQDIVACVRMGATPDATDYLASGPHRRVLRILQELCGDTPPGSAS
jgi:SAM-dependent methyltransferase